MNMIDEFEDKTVNFSKSGKRTSPKVRWVGSMGEYALFELYGAIVTIVVREDKNIFSIVYGGRVYSQTDIEDVVVLLDLLFGDDAQWITG